MSRQRRYFKAILKTEGDRILEDGYACILHEERAVQFRSAFVPLMKLGSTAKIVRVMNDQETHCFIGKVYLSSSKLLRIVNVNDKLLAEVELALSVETSIKAKLSPVLSMAETFHLPIGKLIKFDADVYSISMTTIKFTSTEKFAVGAQLTITTEEPVQMKKVLIEVYQTIAFGQEKNGYRCKILSLPEPASTNLTEYLSKLNQIFPEYIEEEDEDEEGGN